MSDFNIDLNGIGEELEEDADGNLHYVKKLPINPTEDLQKFYDIKKRQVQVNEERIQKFMDENKMHREIIADIETKAIARDIILV